MKVAKTKSRQMLRKLAVSASMAVLATGLVFTSPIKTADAGAIIERYEHVLTIEASQGILLRLDKPASNIFIANPLVADVQVKSSRLIYVFGLMPGATTIYAVDDNENVIYSATIEVTQNLIRVQEALVKLLPSASIEVQSINGVIVLTGFAQSPADADFAQRMVQEMLLVRIEDNDVVSEYVQQRVINRIQVSTPTQVNLRVKMAEMSRNTLKTLGFNWENDFFGGNVFASFITGSPVFELIPDPADDTQLIKSFFVRNDTNTPFGTSNSVLFNASGGHFDLNGVIDALEGEGYLSILAEPNLTALSGEPASFLAGGEFPIPVPQGGASDSITIVFKEFGVGLSFLPTVLSENKIHMRISPEVSQLSNIGAVTIGTTNIPALTTRRVSTTVELASGQSLAIAGLLQSNITQQVEKYPWLGDIPILGTLFRSTSFQREETELVIIVTPYIVRPVNAERLLTPVDINHLPSDTGEYLYGMRDLAGDGGLKTGNE